MSSSAYKADKLAFHFLSHFILSDVIAQKWLLRLFTSGRRSSGRRRSSPPPPQKVQQKWKKEKQKEHGHFFLASSCSLINIIWGHIDNIDNMIKKAVWRYVLDKKSPQPDKQTKKKTTFLTMSYVWFKWVSSEWVHISKDVFIDNRKQAFLAIAREPSAA